MSEQLTFELEEIPDTKTLRAKRSHNEAAQEWQECCDLFRNSAIKYAANCGIEANHIICDINKDKSVSFKIDEKLIAKLFPNPSNCIAFPLLALKKYAADLEFSLIKSPEGYGGIWLKDKACKNISLDILERIIIDYVPSHSFGCCHRFKECSLEKQCIHPDLFYAKGCQYRKNLEAGKVFY